ncbi:RNA-binding ribosome biosynthesis protein mak21 [Malassezia brasiliensis]|uniref:RNA-binding ribosome biosynthesis protein mak21 n=1 Tax=Malassezia brasiliensis TaxID=1821822 RepID=A0AAF0INS0_9BASI|nr:RNA-binding ribosome biosynthesis protein mak21 [Malassezia brasiliensis]
MEALSQWGKIDYCGQRFAEQLYQYVLIIGAVVAFVAGYLRQDLALTLYIFLAFAIASLVLDALVFSPAMSSRVEETKKLNKQLSKAASDGKTEDVLALLKQLKQVVEPTEELIRATKIGVAVGKLRTHADTRVSDLAKELVKTWKAQVEKQRRESSAKDKPKAEPPAAAEPAPPAEAPVKSDKPVNIDFEVLNDKTRNACLKLLYSSLELAPDAEAQVVYSIAMRIEQAALDTVGHGAVNGDYRAKIRSLSLNLKDKNNPELREQVLLGEITPEKLVVMRSEDMASSARKAERERLQEQNLHNAKGAEAQEAETDAFQCGKCKQRRTRYYQMQTRSADEPIFATMGRDFRPKGKGGAPRARPKRGDTDDEDVPEEELLRQVQALGGDADDVALMRSKGNGTQVNDAQLSSELAEFMKKENMQLPALSAAPPQARAPSKPAKVKAAADAPTKGTARPESKKEPARAEVPKKDAMRKPEAKHVANAQPKSDQRRSRDASQAAAARPAGKHMVFEDDTPRVVTPSSLKLLIEPVSEWTSLSLPTLPAAPAKTPKTVPDATVDALHALGDQVLRDESETYTRLGNGEGGRNVTLGTLTQSDLQFARTLLTSNKAGTLSDRISAVTLLLQNSPLHNTKALETLMHMAGKPGREEASRATRALADWFASGGGLGPNKLHYFRDQPALRDAAAVHASGTTQALRLCVCVWAYEDLLKKTYFAFVQLLERQSHDTLLFMRKQAVTQIFMLLRDKPEQEHNLLRLLTNKLGDPDRSVASKASTHLMELLHAHPAMKSIVLREVSETVLRSQVVSADAKDGKARGNQHATYYGVLTLNQTLFTTQDAELANEVFSVYFQLFDVCLAQEAAAEKHSPVSEGGARDKKRWRDKKAPTSREQVNKAASDVDSRLLAAILTGIRRVFPFTTLSSAALDKHLDTLFRITHTHSFNIAIQALQLVFQVAIGTSRDADAPQFSSQVADRYYRTLYDSLLDTRLATTSKQAMYLNLLYKSLKADLDSERVKAFVKRLCQILALQEPPFICGALVLLNQLFAVSPGLRAMLTEPEEEGVEHFADQTEETGPRPQPTQATSLYDGRKRDPRFARAGDTALWDILPLVHHFHPSVSVNAKQLIAGEKVSSNPDLTLNTLMHFLDRFVFRNPKKVSAVKGSSIMQPALSGGDLDADVVVRRTQVPLDYVNSAAFWNQDPENVPADQQFFLQYFQTKQKRAGQAPAPAENQDEATSADEAASADETSDAELSTDDEEEKEIWKAMKRSIPQEREDDVDLDDDDEMLEALEGAEDDESEDQSDEAEEDENEDDDGEEASADDEDQKHLAGSDSDDEPAMFLEDEDDLVPFARFEDDSDDETTTAGKKRPAEDTDAAPTSKNRKRTEQRRKRREAPAFASAEDYAHMLASDDEGNL